MVFRVLIDAGQVQPYIAQTVALAAQLLASSSDEINAGKHSVDLYLQYFHKFLKETRTSIAVYLRSLGSIAELISGLEPAVQSVIASALA